MFGKKHKKNQQPAEKISAQVTAIPKEFYGGGNPVVYPKGDGVSPVEKTTKVMTPLVESAVPTALPERHRAMSLEDARKALEAVSGNLSTPAEKTKTLPAKAMKQPKGPKPPRGAHPQKPHTSSKKPLIIIATVVALLFAAGGSWYFVVRDTSGPTQVASLQPVAIPPLPTTPPPPPIKLVVPTTTESIILKPDVPTTTPSLQETPLSFPRVLLVDASDLDGDSLTDEEEPLFGTDLGVWDSDEDGYYDGQEVMNLYNPNGFAPVRLIDSGFVRDYAHTQWQYRVYYPLAWDAASVDKEERQVLFSAITGDFIEVRVMDRRSGESFEEWFGREATGQYYTDLQPIENRFQEQGMRRNDNLVAYFTTDAYVFILIYNPGVTGDIPYRHVMQMMYQSFRPGRNIVPLPVQRTIPPVLGQAPTALVPPDISTTTIEIDSPSSTPYISTSTSGTSFGDL